MQNNAFGTFLFELRKEKNLTQSALAEKLNLTNKAVSKWEMGETMPETHMLLPLANILGVTIDELLNGRRNTPVPAPEKQAPAQQGQTTAQMLQSADTLFDLGEYDKAEAALHKAIETHPSDWRVWFGMVKFLTANFADFNDTRHYAFFSTALKTADSDGQEEILSQYQLYTDRQAAHKKHIAEQQEKARAEKQHAIESARRQKKEARTAWWKRHKKVFLPSFCAAFIAVFAAIFLPIYLTQSMRTVTFYYHNGMRNTEINLRSGGRISPPSSLSDRPTYQFDGWYTSRTGGTQYDFNNRVKENFNLHARWSSRPVTSLSAGSGNYIIYNDGYMVARGFPNYPGAKSTDIHITTNQYIDVSMGASTVFAIDTNGALWSWNSSGNRTRIGGTRLFETVSAGAEHCLAIDIDGDLWAWGNNYFGQIGDGTTTFRSTPVRIMHGTQFKKIAAGDTHSLAIDAQNNLWAWGSNTDGQAGVGAYISEVLLPVQPISWFKVQAVAAGYNFSAALGTNGDILMWGRDITSSWQSWYSPVYLDSRQYKQISVGSGHIMAIDTNGRLWAMGNNNLGQVGNGSTSNRISYSVQIMPNHRFTHIALWGANSLMVDESNTVWGCGSNGFNQLDNNTPSSIIRTPVIVR
ncbi:MAG: helix-turn-helix domain-containing protein [Firmicutes bacterium]|nr:helix-turn-helix domain-containing protein [Bacillota bacterium]